MKDFSYGDMISEELLKDATGGVDRDKVYEAITDSIEALKKQAQALKDATYPIDKFEQVSKAMAHTSKVVDGLARLLELLKGNADSRPDAGYGAILEVLEPHQLDIVKAMVDENRRKAEAAGETLQ